MRSTRLSLLAATAILGGVSASIHGGFIYDQPPAPTGGFALTSELTGQQEADNWVADTDAAILGFRWWGSYIADDPAVTDAFTLRIWSDIEGLPGLMLEEFDIGNDVTRTPTALVDSFGRDVFEFEADLDGGFAASVGETVWFNIMNDMSTHGGPVWKWYEGVGGDDIHAARANPGADWVTSSGDFAFALIPAPSAIALLALAGAAGRRRRRS